MHRPLRLTVDSAALVQNWRWLADRAGVPAGAAIKADAYGLGAREAMQAMRDQQPNRIGAPEVRTIRVPAQIGAVGFERRLEREHSSWKKEGEAKIGYSTRSHKDALAPLFFE